MAYIKKEHVSQIRKQIKEQFPVKDGWKFSIVREYHTSVEISIMKAPFDFGVNHKRVNNHNLSEYVHGEQLRPIFDIAMEGNHDNSDMMTDYFDVGWYVNVYIGKWDVDFTYNPQ